MYSGSERTSMILVKSLWFKCSGVAVVCVMSGVAFEHAVSEVKAEATISAVIKVFFNIC